MRAAADAIADAFALGAVHALHGPVARGEQGQVWRLVTARGAFAVKETFAPPDPDALAEGAAFAEAAAAAGVPTPAVVRTVDGALLHAAGDVVVRVNAWVDLGAPDRRADPAAIGRLLAAVHGTGFHGAMPADPWYAEPVAAARWRELTGAVVEQHGPHAAALGRLCEEFVALEALVEPPRELVTCHRDLWADNVLPGPDGGLWVIDWDECGLADPAYELAAVLWEFAGGEAARARRLHAAYVAAGGPGRVTRRSDFSMAIAQIGHIGEDALATWLDPATPADERARQADRIGELVEGDLTVDVIDGLLAAVADA